MPEIAILDYGVGNLLSVERACHFLEIAHKRTSDPTTVMRASHLVLPGVGAFGAAIAVLREKGLDQVILDFVRKGRPVLGICLGMQLLFEKSHEFGLHEGLGLIPGEVTPISQPLQGKGKVPSIGWKKLDINHCSESSLPLGEDRYFYFVHSFMGKPKDDHDLVASYNYCGLRIPGVVRRNNVIGVQFHPEKSGNDGLELIRVFSKT
jgi:glutamine amidotransferase